MVTPHILHAPPSPEPSGSKLQPLERLPTEAPFSATAWWLSFVRSDMRKSGILSVDADSLESSRYGAGCRAASREAPPVGFLEELGLLEKIGDRFFLTARGGAISDELETTREKHLRESAIRNLIERQEFSWCHETFDRSAYVAVSLQLLTNAWWHVGEPLVHSILQNGGRVVIIQFQEPPLRGSADPEERNIRCQAIPRLKVLQASSLPQQLVHLMLGTNSSPSGSATSAWIRDEIGVFASSSLMTCPAGFREMLYLPSAYDRLAGCPPLDQEITGPQPRTIKRLTPDLKVVGGFFYPLGDNTIALSDAAIEYHNKAGRGAPISTAQIVDQFAVLGRPNVLVLPHLSVARIVNGDGCARHIDTSLCQVGDTMLVADVSSRVKNQRTELRVDPKLLEAFLERRAELVRRVSNAGFTVRPLYRPDVAHGLDGKTRPIHSVNVLQYFSVDGNRHVIVPWCETNSDQDASLLESNKGELLAAGADSVISLPFSAWGGGLRCVTQHLPSDAVRHLSVTNSSDAEGGWLFRRAAEAVASPITG